MQPVSNPTVLRRVSGVQEIGGGGLRSEEPSGQRGLVALDALLEKGVAGVVTVNVPDKDTAAAVLSHVIRRGKTRRKLVHEIDVRRVDSVWCEARRLLGATDTTIEPEAAAEFVGDQLGADSWLVIHGPRFVASWDEAVMRHLSERNVRGMVLAIMPEMSRRVFASVNARVRVFDIEGNDQESVGLWLQGVVDELKSEVATRSLAELERWWRNGEAGSLLDVRPALRLSEQAQSLLNELVLVKHSWPVGAMGALASAEVWQELLDTSVVVVRGNWLVLTSTGWEVRSDATREQLVLAARALGASLPSDPWAQARASLLWLRAGEAALAVESLDRVASLGIHPAMRHDLWNAIQQGVVVEDGAMSGAAVLSLASRALNVRELDVAVSLARDAERRGDVDIARGNLLAGEALFASGDLAGALVAFKKTLNQTVEGSEAWLLASAHLSEVALWDGRLDEAQRLASSVVASSQRFHAWLTAHNVLGKLALARGQWQLAQEIFAEDESVAEGNRWFEQKMRARINRAISLASSRDTDSARHLLEHALAVGRAEGHSKVEALARMNLAVVAHLEGRFADALADYELALELARQLGDRLMFIRPALDLADLRIQVGMLAEASQAIRFARRVCPTGVPSTLLPQVLMLEGEVLLRQGKSQEARLAVTKALQRIGTAAHGNRETEGHRLMVRVELHEGHVRRAREALDAARRSSKRLSSQVCNERLAMLVALADGNLNEAREAMLRATGMVEELQAHDLVMKVWVTSAEVLMALGEQRSAVSALRRAERAYREMSHSLPAFLLRSLERRVEVRTMRELERRTKERSTSTSLNRDSESPPSSGRRGRTGKPIVGNHPRIRKLREVAARMASNSSAPVLVLGESGTGKELVAEALHFASERADKPLVKVNCAALVEDLLLSELFGHEKGAFTGATARKRGRFELADGGTLFLDEIGDISPKTQVALLRVLQDGTFDRVGGNRTLSVDVRVVCATNRDLSKLVEQGKFREDLYYRLSGLVLRVPPLRERGDDIELVANHILSEIAQQQGEQPWVLSADGVQVLREHSWPGNVRELENVLRAATLFADGRVLDGVLIGEQIRSTVIPESPGGTSPGASESVAKAANPNELAFDWIRRGRTSLPEMKRELERACIVQALSETDGNITRAAQLLGMKRPRLSQIVKEMGLQKNRRGQG